MADFMFFDWETRGPDLTEIGSLNYVLDARTRILLLTYQFDDGPCRTWVPDLSDLLSGQAWDMARSMVDEFSTMPLDVRRHIEAGGYVIAWNTAFDRHVWQQIATPELGFSELKIEQTLDCMAQAQASNLPGKLDMAGRALKLGGKTQGGAKKMKEFANLEIPLPDRREDWELYLSYGRRDTKLVAGIWKVTRPLAIEEWQDYWVSERINDRGIGIDLEVCEGAVLYREEEKEYVEAECLKLSQGRIKRPTLTKQINEWMYSILDEALSQFMVKERDEETGEPIRFTLDRRTVERLLDEIMQMEYPPADYIVEFLELMQYGRSSSALKFQKMRDQSVDARLHGSFVFNGAGQTGRYSSRGAQLHNMVRDAMANEIELLDMVAAQAPIEQLREFGNVSHVLSKLIRPTLIAPEKKIFVWGDWSSVEAVVLPWLAQSRDAERSVLAPFREGKDIYILNAADIFHTPVQNIIEGVDAKEDEYTNMRQAGKVAVLALGFGGSVGAYKAMARGYKLKVTNEDAKHIVDGWRNRNRWARTFWNKLEKAAFDAMRDPGKIYPAGRVAFEFHPSLLRGTLLMYLPDGRPLTYPIARITEIETPWGEMKDAITYLNGNGRNSMWYGKFAENATQATAASLLRLALKKIEANSFVGETVGHTHDEILVEGKDEDMHIILDELQSALEDAPPWAKGLPLKAGMCADYYYHK